MVGKKRLAVVAVVAVEGLGEGVEKEGEVSEEKRKRSASFFPTARDRSGQSSEIGGAPEPPRFLVLFFSAALVVHKSVSEALVQTRGSKKKQSKRGRNECGAEEIQPPPPPPPVIEKGRRRLQVIVRAPLFVPFGAPFRDSSALRKRGPLGWRKLAKRVPESRGGKKRRLSPFWPPPAIERGKKKAVGVVGARRSIPSASALFMDLSPCDRSSNTTTRKRKNAA